jgi:hypothetical protein
VQSLWSGKCLDVPGGDASNGNKLWVWDCDRLGAGLPQRWHFFHNQLYYLGDTTKCVDLPGGNAANGNQLQIWDCNEDLASQKWAYDPNMKTIYWADNTGSPKCLDLRDGGTADGTPVQIWDCTGDLNSNQMWAAQPEGGQTSVTDELNAAIAPGSNGVYSGGKGLLVRNPFDNYESLGYQVVPSTFWTNDIVTPSAVYPTGWNGFDGNGDANCPNDGWNGFYKLAQDCNTDARTGESGPWNYATTAYVICDKLDQVFPDFDTIQSEQWGNGVFYPTDSNSVDQRCKWVEEHNGWDCPGGWLSAGGDFMSNKQQKGSGYYKMGNPHATPSAGGGTGCHFDLFSVIDQTNAYDGSRNLVSGLDCQCDYSFKSSNWGGWVDHWVQHGNNTKKDDGWFPGGKAPSHGLDQASCWVNNPRDMINLQNMIYWKRYEWSNQLTPKSNWNDQDPASLRVYWGWNEVPLGIEFATDESMRHAVMIKLPAAICPGSNGGLDTVGCLSYGAQENLEGDLWVWIKSKIMYPGVGNINNRPGSYVVFAREYMLDANGGTNWQRWFYCENWIVPSGKLQVRYFPKSDSNPTGACYLDYGPNWAPNEEVLIV